MRANTNFLCFLVFPALLIDGKSLQPRRIITLESQPARRASGVVSLPEGSPWCRGNPTILLPGHKVCSTRRPKECESYEHVAGCSPFSP